MNSNKGFSLVELIIVIAIMAILVGVMAPQLIKYIEKGKVSADTQYLDTLHTALVTASLDPDVLTATDNSKNQISHIYGGVVQLNSFGGVTVFTENVFDILGEPKNTNMQPFANNIKSKFKSRAAASNGFVMVGSDDGNTLYLWIDHSDRTGNGGDFTCANIEDLESSNVIYVK